MVECTVRRGYRAKVACGGGIVAENKVHVELGVLGRVQKEMKLAGEMDTCGQMAWDKGGVEGTGASEGSSELKDPGKRATITDSKSNGARS